MLSLFQITGSRPRRIILDWKQVRARRAEKIDIASLRRRRFGELAILYVAWFLYTLLGHIIIVPQRPRLSRVHP